MNRWRDRLSDVSIFDWCGGPLSAIFCRELVVALRHRRYALLLMGLSGLLLVAITVNFLRMFAGVIPTAELVTNTVGLQCTALLLILFFVLPALSAVTLATERFQGTDDLLRMALREPVSLVVAKLGAMIALFTVFQIALLPFSVFTYFFAGIEVESFFKITCMLYGTALCHCIMGLSISRAVRHPGQALFWIFSVLLLVYLVPSWQAGQLVSDPVSYGSTTSWYFNPLHLLRNLLHGIAGWLECLRFLGFQIATTLLVILLSVLGEILVAHAHLTKHIPRLWAMAPSETRPYIPVPDWANPAYHKDCMTMPLAQLRWSLLTGVIGLIGAIVFTFWSGHTLRFSVTAQELYTIVLIIVTPLLVLERCRREMDPTTLLMLRVTRLGSERILLGKALCVIRCLMPATLGVMVGGVLLSPLISLTTATGGGSNQTTTFYLLYQSALLPLKLGLFTTIAFACVRFRAANTTDIAFALVLATLLCGGAEFTRSGLFDTSNWGALRPMQFAIIHGAQLVTALLSGTIVFVIALTRFETVFDEGFDVFAAKHVERESY